MAEIPHELKIKAEFSNEMLEQIRAVVRKEVREEVRAALNENESERMMEEAEDTSTIARSSVVMNECVPEIEGHPSITAELEHEGKLYKGILYFVRNVDDELTPEQEAFLKGQRRVV